RGFRVEQREAPAVGITCGSDRLWHMPVGTDFCEAVQDFLGTCGVEAGPARHRDDAALGDGRLHANEMEPVAPECGDTNSCLPVTSLQVFDPGGPDADVNLPRSAQV